MEQGVRRDLGLLASTIGRHEDSVTHFQGALSYCRQAEYRPELAWTCCDYADMFRERDGPGDQDKAATLLDEALAISTELGMKPLMERVLARREILGHSQGFYFPKVPIWKVQVGTSGLGATIGT